MTERRDAREYRERRDQAASGERAQEEARDKAFTSMRNALMWTFDRLSIDGGMTVREQRYTMQQIGNVLLGRPSPAASYQPNEWDESARLKP